MKILIASFTTKKYMPYLSKYIELLEDENCIYDIIYMDRQGFESENYQENEYCYCHKMPIKKAIMNKLIPYFGYYRYAKKIVKKNSYDKIIFLTTAPAVLLYNTYFSSKKKDYVLDYRDYTFEKIAFYQRLVYKIVDNSYATFISSAGFKKYVGDFDNVYLTHNISNFNKVRKSSTIEKSCICIGFVGCVRYFDVNSELINKLSNEAKYKLLYIGPRYDDCDLNSYCKQKNILNVKFVNSFDNEDKAEIYREIDIVNSIYSLDSPEVRFAVPNRLYDAALYKKPIIVARGTYLESVVNKYGLGIAVDVFHDDVDAAIEEYFSQFDLCAFEKRCDTFLEKVFEDEMKWKEIMKSFLHE